MKNRNLVNHIIDMHTDPTSNDQPVNEVANKMSDIFDDMFDREMRSTDWPYDFSEYGISTKINDLVITPRNKVYMGFEFSDKNGEKLLDEYKVKWFADGPKTSSIYVSKVKKNNDYKGNVKINLSDMLMQRSKDFLKANQISDRENSLSFRACSSKSDGYVGGYVWATKGFDFADVFECKAMQNKFRNFLKKKGIALSEEEVKLFSKPCHFAAFDNGQKTMITSKTPVKLSKEQIQSGYIAGKKRRHKLTEEEIKTGKTNRIAVPYGKEFLLNNKRWGAIWTPSMEGGECDRFAKMYAEMKKSHHLAGKEQSAIEVFDEKRQDILKRKTSSVNVIAVKMKNAFGKR